jgi:hypothetical protein
MRSRKHFVQWLAVSILYWMVAYTIANLVSYAYYVFGSLSQIVKIWHFIGLLYSCFLWSFVFNQFWDLDMVMILPSGIVWATLLFLSRRLYWKVLVIALWSSLLALCLYFSDGVLISLDSFQKSYYGLFFVRHLISSLLSPLLMANLSRNANGM